MSSIKERWKKLTTLAKIVVVISLPITLPVVVAGAGGLLLFIGIFLGIDIIFNLTEE